MTLSCVERKGLFLYCLFFILFRFFPFFVYIFFPLYVWRRSDGSGLAWAYPFLCFPFLFLFVFFFLSLAYSGVLLLVKSIVNDEHSASLRHFRFVVPRFVCVCKDCPPVRRFYAPTAPSLPPPPTPTHTLRAVGTYPSYHNPTLPSPFPFPPYPGPYVPRRLISTSPRPPSPLHPLSLSCPGALAAPNRPLTAIWPSPERVV